MNKTYCSIWNQALQTWVAAPETARRAGKKGAAVLVVAAALLAQEGAHADTAVTLFDKQVSTTPYATSAADNLTLNVNGGTATQSGLISGTGSMSKGGAGVLVLTGNNSYSAGTSVDAGALQVDGNAALGLTSAPITVTNGGLRLGLDSSYGGETFNRALTLKKGSNAASLNSAFGSNTWSGDVTLVGGNASATANAGAKLTLTGNISTDAASYLQLRTAGDVALSGVTTSNVGAFRDASGTAGATVLRIDNSNINAGVNPNPNIETYGLYNIRGGASQGAVMAQVTNSTLSGQYGFNNNQKGNASISDSTLNGVLWGSFTQWGSQTSLARVTINVNNPNGYAYGVDSLISSHTDIQDSTINARSSGGEAVGLEVRYGTSQALEKGGTASLSGNNFISTHRLDMAPPAGDLTSAILLEYYTQGFGSVDVSGKLTIDSNGKAFYNRGGTLTLTDATVVGVGDSANSLPMFVERNAAVMLFKGATAGNNQWGWEGPQGFFDISGVQTTTPFVLGSLQGGSTIQLGGHVLAVGGANTDTTFSGSIQDGGQSGGVGSALLKTGTGQLTLSGSNTYTGGTTVEAGSLIAGSSTALVQDSAYTVNGGTLNLGRWDLKTSSFSGTGGTVALQAQALTVNQAVDSSYAGAITGSGQLVKLGAGALTLSGNSDYAGGTALKVGRLNVGSSTALGTGTLSMDDGTTLGFSASGVNLANNVALTGNNDPVIDTGSFDAAMSGSISGAGFLTKQGTGALSLSGTNTYTGATDVAQGTLKAGAVNTFSNASAHTVAAGAVLDLAGYSQTLASLNNSGTVKLSGSAPGTVLTLTGPYVGQNGVLGVSTVLGTDGSASDKLLLSGTNAVASGSTSIQVTNAGGLGALTTGNGIEVVGTANGASLAPASFTLAGEHVDAGAYEYRLFQTAQGAALQSNAVGPGPNPRDLPEPPPKPTPAPAPEPTPTPVPTPAPAPAYRAEVPLISAMPAQLRQADMAMLGDLHKRMGDEGAQASTGMASTDMGASRRIWGRVLRTDPTISQQGTVSPESSGHMTGFQAGLDLFADKNLKAGLYVGQLDGDMSVNGFASGVEGKYVGFNSLRSRYLGVYGTWQGDSGMYADAVLQAADYRSDLHTAGNTTMARTKGSGWLASMEVGKPYALNSHWQIEPQAQIIYRKLSIDDTALSMATVRNRADDDWTLRLGARIKGSFATSAGVLQPYGRINIYKASNTSDIASFVTPAATTDIQAKGGYTATELAAGASLQINNRTSIYGELGKLWANGGDSRVKSGIQASLGVRVRW